MGNKWKQWQIFLGSKITVSCDRRQEIQRCLLFGRKVMTNLDSVLKSRDITLQTKVCIVSYGFSSCHVWISELDHKDWGPKNWCSWTVILEKTLETPLDSKETNQSIQKEINPEHSLEGLMLNLKLQYFGHLMHKASSLEKTLTLGKIEGKRRRGE